MITLPEFKKRVARKLGVLAVSNTLGAEDSTLIGERCESVQAQLEVLEIAQIDFDDGVEDLVCDVLVAMVAALLVDDFMLGEPKRSQIASEGALGLPQSSPAERQLRKFMSATFVSKPVKVDYF